MEHQEILNKINKFKQHISFSSSRNEMAYTIHKFFDLVYFHKNLINDKIIIKISKDNNVIPAGIYLPLFVEENKKIWSQEYKVHFDLKVSDNSEYYFLKFSIDRKTKPKKVFVKEYNLYETMAEVRDENKLQKLS